jgi:peptidyl-prolyl cis-trans isomerase SurA
MRLLLAAALLFGGVAHARVVDRVAAVVNKEVVTLSEIYDLGGDFIEARAVGEGPDGPNRREAELEVLDSLIQRALIAQEIERLDLDVTREELERTIDDIARQNGIERSRLKEEVERSGMDWAGYREELKENLRQMKFSQVVIQPRVQVTDDEIRHLYNQRVKSLTRASGSRVLQGILLPWPADNTPEARAALALEAQELVERAGDERWGILVSEHPESPYHAAGGEMGTYKTGELMSEVERVVFSTAQGEVGGPIALDAGLLIVRVAAVKAGEAPSLEMVRADLEQELLQQKTEQELELWYTQARRQATVDIKLETGGAL